ncbi:hypothetical protein CRG98_035902 [Punica granatum]|uniref:Uncharacterized protein n=1 Tax=Punica granatum TaxID=22663 RepID=A0A2I0IIW2_PUNGR|nr:hypothetical protein CRG98_035902 [Punica granatum]
MVSTTAFECSAPKEKYLESPRDGGDLLGTDKVEKHRLSTRGKASKFLISNVVFDVPTLVKQTESTCRGQVEKPWRMVELGLKAPITQPGVEIIWSISEWRPKSLRWNSLQVGDSFGGRTKVKLRKPSTLEESKVLGLSDRRG